MCDHLEFYSKSFIKKKMKVKIAISVVTLLVLWISLDLFRSQKANLREFDPEKVAVLDCQMWRSYYEKKPLQLFWQLAELTRTQAHAPFWRSFLLAYYASKAAFVFKDGKNRTDYAKALPGLVKYYEHLYLLSDTPFDIDKTAKMELEWWIVRREREKHPPAEWADLQANVAAQLYGLPARQFGEYARLRTEAMLYRDLKGDEISEVDWQKVQLTLIESWQNLRRNLTK